MDSKYLSYSWDSFKRDIDILADSIWKWKYKYILAVTKGWLIPAYFLADALDIKIVKTICLSSYNGRKQGDIVHNRIEWFSEDILRNHKDWLVVDDIVDSWKTMNYIRNKYGVSIAFASIFKRPNVESPKYFVKESQDWIRFPWERRS